jgi:hypothetical protein
VKNKASDKVAKVVLEGPCTPGSLLTDAVSLSKVLYVKCISKLKR